MSLTPTSLLRAQLNLAADEEADSFLTHKLNVAEAWAAAYVGSPLSEPVPAPITEAVLQIAAHLYEQREAATFGTSGAPIPFGVAELLSPYREAVTGHVPAVDA